MKKNGTAADLLHDLQSRLAGLVAAAHAEGRSAALGEVNRLLEGAAPAARGRGRRRGRKAARARTAATPKKARGGRQTGGGAAKAGKTAKKAAAKPAKPAKKASKKARRNPWAGLTPEQRLARVNAIRKGRGLPPKTSE